MLTAKESEIVSKVESNRGLIVDVAKRVIEVPTVNPPGKEFLKLVDVLRDRCEGFGFKVETLDVPAEVVSSRFPLSEGLPRQILVARLRGREARPEVHFSGHYDVVPPGEGWSITDPFTPLVKDGKLYGRGAADMKGAFASKLVAMLVLGEYTNELSGSVSFSAVPDEEVGGSTGTGYMVDHGFVKPDVCIIGEPSGLENMWDAQKGMLWLDVTVKGKAAHGAHPWHGVNAFERVVKLASRMFEEYIPIISRRRSAKPSLPAGTNIPTATIGGVVKGGVKNSIVPDSVTFTVDRRLIPEESTSRVLEEIQSALAGYAERYGIPVEDISVKAVERSEPHALQDPELPRSLSEVVKDVVGESPSVTLCNARLDMQYMLGAGIPTVTYGPGSIEQAHVTDEFVKVDELVDAAKIYSVYTCRRLKAR